MKKKLMRILGSLIILGSLFYGGYKYKENLEKTKKDQKIESYLSEEEIKHYLNGNKELEERIYFTYELNDLKQFDQIMDVKKIENSKGEYNLSKKESTKIRIWKNKEGKIQNFNYKGYGYSTIEPAYFLSTRFLKDLQDSIFNKYPKIKLIGTDYCLRGLWLENILLFEKEGKLNKLIIEDKGGENKMKDLEFRTIKEYGLVGRNNFK